MANLAQRYGQENAQKPMDSVDMSECIGATLECRDCFYLEDDDFVRVAWKRFYSGEPYPKPLLQALGISE